MRIYKFFADLRNVPRIVAIQIVIYYSMSADRVSGLFVHSALLSGCRRRSAPVRSGASQFAPWASAAGQLAYHGFWHGGVCQFGYIVLLPSVGPVRTGASQFALWASAGTYAYLTTYRPRATDCIQAIISVRTSGAKVSSISLYSLSSPVVQCWKR